MSAKRIFKPSVQVAADQLREFTFNGRRYTGLQGDTLASALLANGVKALSRSYKYGRLRGIMSAGAEEPNALVQLEKGAYCTPNVKATQAELYAGLDASTAGANPNGFHVKSLIGKIGKDMMPPGFYSKTFKWPKKMWPTYENVIRGFAGFGSTPTAADAEWYDHLHHHVDVLVVGAGLAGLQAALYCGEAGMSVMLVDEQAQAGGWLLSDAESRFDGLSGAEYAKKMVQLLSSMPNVQVLTRTTAFALHDHNLIQAVELLQDHLPLAERKKHLPRQRLHKIRAGKVILAAGAIERPLVFGNNDTPGVFTVSAAQTYLHRYGVLLGESIVICGNNDEIYLAARDLARAGAQVVVADVRKNSRKPAYVPDSVRVYANSGIAKVKVEKDQVAGADIRDAATGSISSVACEIVLSSGGLSPTVHLYCHDTGRPVWDAAKMAHVVPGKYADCKPAVCNVGAVTGCKTFGEAAAQTAEMVGAFFADRGIQGGFRLPEIREEAFQAMELAVRLPDGEPAGKGAKAFVDYQNDVTAEDIAITIRENYRHVEHVKRYTAFGFGTDQGKLSSVNSFLLTAEAMGVPVEQIGTTTYRPAYTPVSLGVLAGLDADSTFDPERLTAMHASHTARGAEFEAVGQWLRPWYFPKSGEDMHAAVRRECAAARSSVGVIDASTLGKIQIDGPDAREFLNRIYSNAWSKLEPGKCRYGLMLDENGMVMDDGVTACISDQQFYMTTTTGGAAKILSWLERWHQSEWPELKVWMTSVTDHWGTVAVVGPKSRQVLQKLCADIDFSPENFAFMEWKSGTVAGLPARVFRVSFSGELAYEINVEAGYGHYLWEEVMSAGAEFGITPYGTETMHVLRAEKGFIIVGQDTDGSVTPIDLGMSWAVGMKKPFSFLGRRSLSRSDTARSGRKQLVGLLPQDAQTVIPEGAQIVASADIKVPRAGSHDTPVQLLGHITSSYYSAFLGRPIAMAVLENGHERVGQTLYAFTRGKLIPFTVADSTVFVDAAGERQHA